MTTQLWVMCAGLLLGGVLALLIRYQIWRPRRPKHWPRILMYHNINADLPPSGMNTPPHLFEQEVLWLKSQGYRFDFPDALLSNQTDKLVVITLDDGHQDNYFQLWPLLMQHDIKATIYLAPDIADIDKLTPEQIQAMQASGKVQFGAHSLTHVNLAQLDETTACHEITASKQRVEALTGQACDHFAYPFGRFDDTTVRLVQEAGFKTAVTTRKAIIAQPQAQPLTLPRISTSGEMNLTQFKIAFMRARWRI